jgi:hypothetical protein
MSHKNDKDIQIALIEALPLLGKKRRWWVPATAAVIIVLSALGLIQSAPGVVAVVADNVLRPVIGNRATIGLESEMLNLSDAIKRVAYGTVITPNANIYNSQPASKFKTSASESDAASLAKTQAINLAPLNVFQPTFTKLAGEGIWSPVALPQFGGQPLMARTFVRPDPARSYAIVALVQMNMHALHLHAVAGTEHPGAVLGHPGPGVIPAAATGSDGLVAAFNGGFQYIDGQYGMVVGDTTYVPLKPGVGTLTIYQDGTLSINRYSPASVALKPVEAIRQNGPLILDGGNITPDVISGGYAVWGRTTTNSMYTWRSGVGLTKNGNLIYAVGPSLTAQTLAEALKAGGAVEAIQLDINAYWVRFVTFTEQSPGNYSYESILNTLANGGSEYLNGYNKDFFYVTQNVPAQSGPSRAPKQTPASP